jgi:hypothetical protein
MPLNALKFRPGIFRDNTQYSGEGGWYDSDKVRFRLGYPEQIGGWQNLLSQSYSGVSRCIHQWTSLAFNDYVALGTNLKLYVAFEAAVYDITPIRKTVALGNNPFTTQSTSNGYLEVHDIANGCVLNDFVTYSGATGFDNYLAADLNQEFQIIEIVDADNYIIDTGIVPSAGAISGGGAGVSAEYQINTGLADATVGIGYGAGPYSIMPWGGSYSVILQQLRLWQCDNFGEDLIATYRNGDLYYWDLSASVDATGIPNARAVSLSSVAGVNSAPDIALDLGVSDSDRHLIVFGCNDYASTSQNLMLIRWCTQENILDWEPRPDNTSGSLPLSLGSEVIGRQKTRAEFLVWTDRALYSFHFVGPPYYFAVNQISDSVSLIGPKASGEGNGIVFWMDHNAFYLYNGAIQAIDCPVRDYVFQDFNVGQAFKTTCAISSRFNEAMWFYPSSSSQENDRYVLYNYVENTWAIGTLERTAWADLAYQGYPIGCSTTNLYQHEVGYDADTLPMDSFVESCDMDLGDGDSFSFARRFIPDMAYRGGSSEPLVTISWKTRNYPGQTLTTSASSSVGPTTEQCNIRLRARQVVFRLDASGNAIGWRLGTPRIDIQQDGRQ